MIDFREIRGNSKEKSKQLTFYFFLLKFFLTEFIGVAFQTDYVSFFHMLDSEGKREHFPGCCR